jgi:serine/threonine protein kinase
MTCPSLKYAHKTAGMSSLPVKLEVGETVGDYEILSLLGRGGMGKVFKVRNLISDRIEAMKVLLPDIDANPESPHLRSQHRFAAYRAPRRQPGADDYGVRRGKFSGAATAIAKA